MSQGAYLISLLDRPWHELSEDEQDAFDSWLGRTPGDEQRSSVPRGVDLYTLMRSTRRGGKASSVQNMLPVRRGPEGDDR